MSWHYSQALVEEFSAANSSAGALFAPLKESDLPVTYCWRDRTTESLNLFQFGMMSQPSMADPGVALLTWYRVDFLARICPSPEPCGDATGWKVSDPVYGGRCCALLGRFVLPLFSVKTVLLSEQPDWAAYEPSLPPSGMTAAGSLWELKVSDCITGAADFGSTLPTPTARDWKDTLGMQPDRKDGKTRLDRLPMLLFDHVRAAGLSMKTNWANTAARTVNLKGMVQCMITGPDYCPELPEWVMGWPIGWTELKPLATDRFQQWLLSHGRFFT